MIPGVQNPHWEAPWSAKDRHQPSASGQPGQRGDGPAGHA